MGCVSSNHKGGAQVMLFLGKKNTEKQYKIYFLEKCWNETES